jgi:hypothetical protein
MGAVFNTHAHFLVINKKAAAARGLPTDKQCAAIGKTNFDFKFFELKQNVGTSKDDKCANPKQ